MKVLWVSFLNLQFEIVFFGGIIFAKKAARKMFVNSKQVKG